MNKVIVTLPRTPGPLAVETSGSLRVPLLNRAESFSGGIASSCLPCPPVLWAIGCRGCSCSAWKQKVWVSPVPSPPYHPLRLNRSKQTSLLRPEFCFGTKEPFQSMSLPACVESRGSSPKLGGAAWMGPGREGRRLLERNAASSGVGSRRAALLSHLAREVLAWQLSLGQGVSSCCAVILLCRRNRLLLN